MPFCEACGNEATTGETACSKCGARLGPVVASDEQAAIEATSDPFSGGSQIAGQEISRIIAGAWILASVLLLWLSESPGPWAILLVPSWIGTLLPLIRNADLTTWTERLEEKLLARHAQASEKTGKFARFFTKPLYGGCLFIWRKTKPVADAHLRAGIRVAALTYFTAVMVALLIFVGYIVVGVVIVVAVILFILWALSGRLKGGSESPVRLRRATTVGSDESAIPVDINEYRRGYEAGRKAGLVSQLADALFAITDSADYIKGYKDGHQGRDFNPDRRDD